MLENVLDLSILWDDIPELPGQSVNGGAKVDHLDGLTA